MRQHIKEIRVESTGQGLIDFTSRVKDVVGQAYIKQGLCTLFIRHTSASLTIQENADPSARRDLEMFLNKLVPDDDPDFTHTIEGPDDMPSHIKSALTATSLTIPIMRGALVLGTWQGIYLWEHRTAGSQRKVVVHVMGE
ncbi:MAG: secondary thiamine-phosphate synthase enzyme YjbQ [Myxococcota bacterium]